MRASQAIFEAVWMPELVAACRRVDPLHASEETARNRFDLDGMYIRYLAQLPHSLPT